MQKFFDISPRTLLLSAYPYFDISKEEWGKFWKNTPEKDPFSEKTIFPLRSGQKNIPRNWVEAVEKYKSTYACITIYDEYFPNSLDRLSSIPAVLYIEGAERIPSARSLLSIVGTRNPSAFGYTNAENFSQAAAALGFGIVSGFARGIDTIAHQACTNYNSYTLAVLGCGIDQSYPRENAELRKNILHTGGSVISQFPPGSIPFPSNFPRRNALIAALSAGTIVIEGGEKSGAIITGKLALEIGLTSVCLLQDYRNFGGRGAVQLLECGATPVRNFSDALQAIALPWNGYLEPLKGMLHSQTPKYMKSFTLEEYAKQEKITTFEAIVVIEKMLLEGKLERLKNAEYRIKSPHINAKH